MDLLNEFDLLTVVVPAIVVVVAGVVAIAVYLVRLPKLSAVPAATSRKAVAPKKSAAATKANNNKAKSNGTSASNKKAAKQQATAAAVVAPVAEPIVSAAPAAKSAKPNNKKAKEAAAAAATAAAAVAAAAAAVKVAVVKTKPNNKKAKEAATVAPVAVAVAEPAAAVTVVKSAKPNNKKVKEAATATIVVPAAKAAAVAPVASVAVRKAKPTARKGAKASTADEPTAADDGSWLTVPTKGDKKKSGPSEADVSSNASTDSSSADNGVITVGTPEKTSKQLKDQANKVRKAAEAATIAVQSAPAVVNASAATAPVRQHHQQSSAAVPERAPIVVHTVDLASLQAVAAKFSSASGGTPVAGFEYVIPELAPPGSAAARSADRKRADLLGEIEEAIVDVVVKPLQQQPKQQHLFEVLSAVAAEKADAAEKAAAAERAAAAALASATAASVKSAAVQLQEDVAAVTATIEGTVAFDELADAWTEAKAPTKVQQQRAAKKKVRKD